MENDLAGLDKVQVFMRAAFKDRVLRGSRGRASPTTETAISRVCRSPISWVTTPAKETTQADLKPVPNTFSEHV